MPTHHHQTPHGRTITISHPDGTSTTVPLATFFHEHHITIEEGAAALALPRGTMVYKIRRRGQAGWSTGGTMPSWTKNGTSWNTPHTLKAHLRDLVLRLLRQGGVVPSSISDVDLVRTVPNDWEVVTIEQIEMHTADVATFLAANPTKHPHG